MRGFYSLSSPFLPLILLHFISIRPIPIHGFIIIPTPHTHPSSFRHPHVVSGQTSTRAMTFMSMTKQPKQDEKVDITSLVDEVSKDASTTTTSVELSDDKTKETSPKNDDEPTNETIAGAAAEPSSIVNGNDDETNNRSDNENQNDISVEDDEDDEEMQRDAKFMREALSLAGSCGGERGPYSPYPFPIGGALLVTKDDRVIGRGFSNYEKDCVQAAIADAGLTATPLREWCVTWPSNRKLREDIADATLYLTMEPCAERRGSALPPTTQLIIAAGINRVVIGCQDPIQERATEGAATLHSAGLSVTMGIEQEKCESLISQYSALVQTKLQRMARKHLRQHNRPLGLLHCSVVDSTNIEAFAMNGNAFGKDFGSGQVLSTRDFGSYEIAPPPESIWASEETDDDVDPAEFLEEYDDSFVMDFDDENGASSTSLPTNPMMPWYEQVSAVVATFPRLENIPNATARMNGLKWLATQGNALPPAVERILVVDAADLDQLPLTNDDERCPPGVDVESFWQGRGRKKTRVLLRHSANVLASRAANAAAAAAERARLAAIKALEAMESVDAERAAEAAILAEEAATTASSYLVKEVRDMVDLKERLTSKGVLVETLKGGDPIDVMNHLGARSGYEAVVWRAGCWGTRGVKAIMDGAFQWVSAHLAVDADGGRFWQLMLAERCVQAACGPEQRVKIFAEDEDISLEYCDDEDADGDCVLRVDGRPIRHVRLDSRVALVDQKRREVVMEYKTRPVDGFKQLKGRSEDAPWFL